MLRSSQLGKDIIVIGKARVPIIKFTSVQGGFKVDISVNMTNSIKVYPRVLQLFEQVGTETARALIMVTKAFLSQRQMNEVHTGGLGSYSIICLVCSFLQMHPRLQRREMVPADNLGTLLLEFLEVYGKNFNYDEVGICLSGKGSYYSKTRRGWQSDRHSKLTLSIEDPADPTNDVSSGSYNMNQVRQSISGAFEVLTASVYYRTSIILARLANNQYGAGNHSTVRVNTLSGRAIPGASGDEGRDECSKSMLGSILGVTSAVEQSRRDLRRLAELGTVQRSLGLPASEYDEDGMLLPAGQLRSASHDASAPRQRYRFTNTNPNHIRFAAEQQTVQRPPEPAAPPPQLPPAPAPISVPQRNGHNKRHTAAECEHVEAESRAQSAGSEEMDMGTPPFVPPQQQQPPPAKRRKLIDLTTPSPERERGMNGAKDETKTVASATATTARTYINLDSPSPPPESQAPVEASARAEGEEGGGENFLSPAVVEERRSDGPETDSRYSVNKGKQLHSRPDKAVYVPPHQHSGSSSSNEAEEGELRASSDSSVVISSDTDDDGLVPPSAERRRPVMRKSGSHDNNNSNGGSGGKPRSVQARDDDVRRPRTRSRTLSQTNPQSPNLSNAAAENGRASGNGTPKRQSSSSTKIAKTKPTKPIVTSDVRREYWQAKAGNGAGDGDDSSDSDGVYVVSSSQQQNQKQSQPQPEPRQAKANGQDKPRSSGGKAKSSARSR